MQLQLGQNHRAWFPGLALCWLSALAPLAAWASQGPVDSGPLAQAEVHYAREPDALLISFREIWPEFADQDPTELVRIYGDGRVVVHLAAYMQRAGRYEMRLTAEELEALLLELAPVLLAFKEDRVATQRQVAEQAARARAEENGEAPLFYVADAEISVWTFDVEAYRPPGEPGLTVHNPSVQRTWRGLRFDAERYPDLEPIQNLLRMEERLRALAEHEDLVRVGSVP